MTRSTLEETERKLEVDAPLLLVVVCLLALRLTKVFVHLMQALDALQQNLDQEGKNLVAMGEGQREESVHDQLK